MGVEEDSLDVLKLSVVLKCALVKPLLFAESSDFGLIVELPNFHLEDTLNDLGCNHDVDFQHLGLVVSIFRAVLTHAVEEQGSKLLDTVALQE